MQRREHKKGSREIQNTHEVRMSFFGVHNRKKYRQKLSEEELMTGIRDGKQ